MQTKAFAVQSMLKNETMPKYEAFFKMYEDTADPSMLSSTVDAGYDSPPFVAEVKAEKQRSIITGCRFCKGMKF